MQRIIDLFPVWALFLAAAAYFQPQAFAAFKDSIGPLLALIMFCMGMTLHWRDFTTALRQPAILVLAVLLQYGCMPLFAWLIAWLLGLSAELKTGMVLVGASAGGTASNVICYLARGNVALSVLMTLLSTLCAVVMMPLLTWLYLHQTVAVPVWDMLRSIIAMVLLPVLAGTLVNSVLEDRLRRVRSVFPLLSGAAIVVIIAIIIALNQPSLSREALPALLAVVLHNLLGLAAGYWAVRWMRYDKVTARTVSVEVGMQNSGLSVALAAHYFSSLAALPGALFSIWHNLSGSLLAHYWRQSDSKE